MARLKEPLGGALITARAVAAEPKKQPTSYMPVDVKESFASIMARLKAEKPTVEARQKALLERRYDLSNRPASGVTMSRGKPIQEGARLPGGMTWESLAAMTPEAMRHQGLAALPARWPPADARRRGGVFQPRARNQNDRDEKKDPVAFLHQLLTFPCLQIWRFY